MRRGIEGLAEDLMSPKLSGSLGPGSYDLMVQAMRTLRKNEAFLTPLREAWAERDFDSLYARPLLLMACLRYRAMEVPEHSLSYECLMDAQAPDLADRILIAVSDPELWPLLRDKSIESADPARSFAWGLPASVLGLPHRQFHLIELNSPTLVNLVVDRTSIEFRMGLTKMSGFDFPSPEGRIGLSKRHLDLKNDKKAARWLEACIWPGQSERIGRYRASKQVLERTWEGKSPEPMLYIEEAPEDAILKHVEALSGPLIVFDATAYVPTEGDAKKAYENKVLSVLEKRRDALWVTLVPNYRPRTTHPLTMMLYLYRDGALQRIEFGESSFHDTNVMIMPSAFKTLRATWLHEG